MNRIKLILLVLVSLVLLHCKQSNINGPVLYMITYNMETDRTGGPNYQLSFKYFNLDYDFSRIFDNDVVRFEFANPPQDKLFGRLHFIPKLDSGITKFEFMDTGLIGLDSAGIEEIFMKGIVGNRIDVFKNDTILQSIPISKLPIFQYLVGTEKELLERAPK